MTNVSVAVGSDAAAVHFDLTAGGAKGFFTACQGIVKLQSHACDSPCNCELKSKKTRAAALVDAFSDESLSENSVKETAPLPFDGLTMFFGEGAQMILGIL